MDNYLGKTLNGYTLGNLIQAGGVGAVFRARNITLQRDVAVKVFDPRFTHHPSFQERFYKHARVLSQLSHPNIVQVLDYGDSEQLFYIVMEFVPGQTLRQKLEQLKATGQWLPHREATHLVSQICLGVHYLHQNDILQRDLTPDHIILKPHPNPEIPFIPVLIDLGLTELVEDSEATQPEVTISSPGYMSPEQILGKTCDARCDIYSLGVLLFELSVGQLPYPISNISEAVRFHTGAPPPPEIPSSIPAEIAAVLRMSITSDPDNRFNSVVAMAKALDYFQQSLPTVGPAVPEKKPLKTVVLPKEIGSPTDQPPTQLSSPPEIPGEIANDKIHVLEKNSPSQVLNMKPAGLLIGRKSDADLVLDHPMVSQNHARIDYDGQNYQITDLNSTNGTFIDETRLTPEIPKIWTPDQQIVIGDFSLRLERSIPSTPQTLAMDMPVVKKTEKMPPLAAQDLVEIFIETKTYSVEPGDQALIRVTLLNKGVSEDQFAIGIDGIPPDWIPAPPAVIQLVPGVQEEVEIPIRPPRFSSARAGEHSFTVQVRSQKFPEFAAEEVISLTVLPFYQFTSTLRKGNIKAGRKAQVIIENTGNTPDQYEVSWRDLAPELVFEPPQTRVDVAEGQKESVHFRARARSRNLFGSSQNFAFFAQVQSNVAGTQKLNGEVISGAVIPLWILPVLVIVVLLALVGLGSTFLQNRSLAAQATQTAVVQTTATALAALSLDTDADTITDVDEMKLGTDPRNPDTDGDGLNDSEELALGTSPVQADTDADGLTDGDENLQGTNPFAIDSDGDTLPDGMEVNDLGTSPTSRDTDGDGMNDNVDPEPVSITTPQVVSSPTSEPESTPEEGVWTPCEGLYNSQLHVDDLAMVAEEPPVPNRVRKEPDTNADILFFVFPGKQVKIIGGPECGNGFVWWQIKDKESDRTGWTSEGDVSNYWLIPVR